MVNMAWEDESMTFCSISILHTSFSPISAVFVPLCPAVSAVYTIILHDYRKVFNGYKIKSRLGGP